MTTGADLQNPLGAPDGLTREAAVRNYEFFSLGALLVLLLVLLHGGLGLMSLIPFLVGLGGIAARWRMALPLLLLSLGFAVTDRWLVAWSAASLWEVDALSDGLLAAAVLAYAAGQQRLLGVARTLVPADPRPPVATKTEKELLLQPARRADYPRELLVLAAGTALAALLAPLVWDALPSRGIGLGVAPRVWRLVILAWLLGLGLVIGAGLIAYLQRKHRHGEEAAVYLQDLFWRATRGEQARLQRWRAWARLRAQRRRKDGP